MNLKFISSVVFTVGMLTSFASPALAVSAQVTVDAPLLALTDTNEQIGTLYAGEIVEVTVRYKKKSHVITSQGVVGWVNTRKLDFDYLDYETSESVSAGGFDQNIDMISGFGN